MRPAFIDRRPGRYRLECPVRVDQPLILVTQIQRSGGTLLSSLFDGHPQIHAHPYELNWGRPKKWNWPDLDPADWSLGTLFARLQQEWITKQARRGFYAKGPKKDTLRHPFVFDLSLQRDLFMRLGRERLPQNQRQALDLYLTSFFNAWYDCQNLYATPKRFVSAFTPRILMVEDSLDRFARDYPDGYLVSSVRHPAGWYASAMQHKYGEKYGSLENVLDHWLRSTRAILEAKRRFGDRLIVCTFESLIGDTEAFMRRVCARTGLDWHPILTLPTFNALPAESNSHFESTQRIDPSAGERFRKVLPADAIATIERLAGDLHAEAQEMIRRDQEA